MEKRITNCRSKGFTLIELLIVVVIILILASILFPVFVKARDTARKASCVSNLRQIGIAIGMYREDYNGYPAQPWMGTTDPLWSTWGYGKWIYMIQPYIKGEKLEVFVCPSATKRIYIEGGASAIPNASYGMNEFIFHIFSGEQYYNKKLKYPSELSLVADCNVNLLYNDWGVYLPQDNWETNPANGDGIQLPRGMMRIKYANGNVHPYSGSVTGGRLLSRHDGENILYCDLHAKFLPLKLFDSIPKTPNGYYTTTHSQARQRPLIYPDAIPLP